MCCQHTTEVSTKEISLGRQEILTARNTENGGGRESSENSIHMWVNIKNTNYLKQ